MSETRRSSPNWSRPLSLDSWVQVLGLRVCRMVLGFGGAGSLDAFWMWIKANLRGTSGSATDSD